MTLAPVAGHAANSSGAAISADPALQCLLAPTSCSAVERSKSRR
jgi:hypothetical protein